MKSVLDIIKSHEESAAASDAKLKFTCLCRYGADAKNCCVYLPKVEPRSDEEIRLTKINFRKYKTEIGWFSSFPTEDAIVFDLDPFIFKDTNGYFSIDKIGIRKKIAEIRSADNLCSGEYVGGNRERINVSVRLDNVYTVPSKSDFGDLINFVFVTEDGSTLERLQRVYCEDTIRKFVGKSGKTTLVGTVSKQYMKFGRKYTRVKNCELFNDRGLSIVNFAKALRK